MSLLFITGNKAKLAEVQALLPQVQGFELDLPEIQSLDPHEIISAKIKAARAHLTGPIIVEDVSLSINGLKGLPGPLIKWFLKALGNEGLARLAIGSGDPSSCATMLIGYDDGSEVRFFEGKMKGQIVLPRGDRGFGWDPIFLPEDMDKTLAELTQAQKNTISMRKHAVAELSAYLQSQN